MNKLVILDRDGVINQDSDLYIKSIDEYRPIPGSLEAIALLNAHGYTVVVATNQSGVGRGLLDQNTLESIHQAIQHDLKKQGGVIEAFFVCPHTPEDHCECRKPKPGLLLRIAKHFNIDLHTMHPPFIGDALRDLEAAQAAGCTPLLVCTGKGMKTRQTLPQTFKSVAVFPDLLSAAQSWINEHDRS